MKRKQFVKTLGLSLASVYLSGAMSCKKDAVIDDVPDLNGGLSNNPSPPSNLPYIIVLDGYVDKLSYSAGDNVLIYINAKEQLQGKLALMNAQRTSIGFISGKFGPQSSGADPYKNGFKYANFVTYKIPADLRSGLYLWGNKIPFIVKNVNKSGEIVAVLPSNTDNAYNDNGGRSSYSIPFSPILSFQRPYNMQPYSLGFWSWASTLDYKIDYITDADLDDYGNFSYAKILIIPGHSEYWTRKARVNFDTFIDSGSDAMILSGNTMWWQVRYSADGNQMICYKNLSDDEPNKELRTFNWFQKQLNYPIEKSFGMTFDLGGYGDHKDNGWRGFKIVNEKSPLLYGTGLKYEDIISCFSKEYDGAPIKYVKDNPHPVLNNIHNFYKIELIGYDNGYRDENTVGTFIVLQKTKTSGVIIDTASTDWCSLRGMGGKDGEKIKKITLNGIDILLSKRNAFST